MFYIKKDYEQGTFLCNNFNFRQEREFGCCFILFGTVILRKSDSGKAFSHSEKLVIYAFMGYNLTSIYVLYA